MRKVESKVKLCKVKLIVQFIAGIILVIFWGLMIFTCFLAPHLADLFLLTVIMLFEAAGAMLVVLSCNNQVLLKQFNKYYEVIAADPAGSVKRIADSAGESEEQVIKYLKQMINKGFFGSAFLDALAGRIIFPDELINTHAQSSLFQQSTVAFQGQEASADTNAAAQKIPVICGQCGGVNHIVKGSIVPCEYCGSPVRVDSVT